MGGTIKDITTDYIYDKADRLSKLTIADGTTTKNIENFYNGDGQRIKQNEDGLITKYYYDDGNLLFTTDNNNSKETENILDPSGVIVASKRFDGIYNNMYFFYNYDIRGSVTNIINPDGQIVKGYDYDEFGGTKEKGDYAFKNDVKFTGAVHDKSANLYYMNARFYNPNTGRFITEDTYSGNAYEPWTQHLYSYTSNNPVNFIDPTGHRAMYAMNPEDETEEQRLTSLTQMRGYKAVEANKIARKKIKKQENQRRLRTLGKSIAPRLQDAKDLLEGKLNSDLSIDNISLIKGNGPNSGKLRIWGKGNPDYIMDNNLKGYANYSKAKSFSKGSILTSIGFNAVTNYFSEGGITKRFAAGTAVDTVLGLGVSYAASVFSLAIVGGILATSTVAVLPALAVVGLTVGFSFLGNKMLEDTGIRDKLVDGTLAVMNCIESNPLRNRYNEVVR